MSYSLSDLLVSNTEIFFPSIMDIYTRKYGIRGSRTRSLQLNIHGRNTEYNLVKLAD